MNPGNPQIPGMITLRRNRLRVKIATDLAGRRTVLETSIPRIGAQEVAGRAESKEADPMGGVMTEEIPGARETGEGIAGRLSKTASFSEGGERFRRRSVLSAGTSSMKTC